MAIINKYKVTDNGNTYEESISDSIHSSTQNGEDFGYIDFDKATKSELLAFRQGWVDHIVSQRNFVQTNDSSYDNESLNQTNQNTQNKTLSLSNGHSILGSDYPNNSGGFTDRILISLLAGVGLGAICTATYIFIHLGKVTFTL